MAWAMVGMGNEVFWAMRCVCVKMWRGLCRHIQAGKGMRGLAHGGIFGDDAVN